MRINHCNFPERVLYDLDNFVWVKKEDPDGSVYTVGATQILAALAGKLTKIKLKEVGAIVEKNKSVASIESPRYFGMVRSPVKGKIVKVNNALFSNPKSVNDFPYDDGWFVKIKTPYSDATNDSDFNIENLKLINECHDEIKNLIDKLHIRCFSAFPDYEMFEIGVECAATLTKLDELIGKIDLGNVVHLAL
jgi:glycine cleavage system H lipoate-binding protein